MAQFVSDTFTGADGATLAAYSASWVRSLGGGTGNVTLLGNRARHSTTAVVVYIYSAVAAPGADYDVSATVYFGSTDGVPSVGVCGRIVDTTTATFYQARFTLGTGIVLARFTANTAVTLASVAYTPTLGAEPKLTLRMRGTQLSVLLDDVVVLGPITDANITAAGYVGLRMASASATTVHMDNLVADDGVVVGGTAGTANAAGIASAAQVGSCTASGGAKVSAAGIAASGATGALAASGAAAASPSGIGSSAQVGTVSAIGGSASVASPIGVGASALTGQTVATGAASTAASGVTASAQVGSTSASAGTSVPANASAPGIGAVASVASAGAAVGRGGATCAPTGAVGYASIGAVIAAGNISLNGTAAPEGVAAHANIGTVAAVGGGLFVRAPSGPGYTPQRNEYQARPASVGGVRPPAIEKAYR